MSKLFSYRLALVNALSALLMLAPQLHAQTPQLKRVDMEALQRQLTPPPSEETSVPAPQQAMADSEPIIQAAGALYSIGNPSDDEQLYLEFINRARANPQAEAQLFKNSTDAGVLLAYGAWNVDLNLMVSQFATLAVKPPLSFEPRLMTAARRQSNDMFQNSFQSHTGSDGSSYTTRAQQAGYSYSNIAENVYASSLGTVFGHTGFDVNWGNGTGGMQTPPGHRYAIHSAFQNYREIGIGVVNDQPKGIYGPQWVTQVFASRADALPMITGVAYYDTNGDGAYSVGEGLSGVSVDIPGGAYSAITSSSGGYSLPVPGNGSYSVTFSGPGYTPVTSSVTIASSNNSKLDFKPTYSSPTVTGPAAITVGTNSSYSISTLPGATSYKWRSQKTTPSTRIEGAESGLADMTPSVDPIYSAQSSKFAYQGTKSFHLAFDSANPSNVIKPQQIAWNRPFRLTAQSALKFYSCMPWSSDEQRASVWIKDDNQSTYQQLAWEQRGAGLVTTCNFTLNTIPLSQFAGKQVTFLFRFDMAGTQYYQGNDGVGLYFDNLEVTNAQEITQETVTTITSGNTFQFNPSAGSYLLQAAGTVGTRTFAWGPFLSVTATSAAGSPPRSPTTLAVN